MASSIAEFRNRLYKEIVLPSGLSAQIRKVQAWDFLGLGELPIPSGRAGNETPMYTEQDTRNLRHYTDKALVKGVVKPPLTDTLDDGGEPVYAADKLHVSELSLDDYNALSTAIMQWSGLTQEDGQAVEAFRADAERAPGESVSGAVSLSAE